MTTAIQSLQSVFMASTHSGAGSLALPRGQEESLPVVPDVIVTLGAALATPLTYTAEGLFESLFQISSTTPDTSNSGTASVTSPFAIGVSGTTTRSASDTASLSAPTALPGLIPPALNRSITAASIPAEIVPAPSVSTITSQRPTGLNPSSVSRADTLTLNQALAANGAIALSTPSLPVNAIATTTAAAGNPVALPAANATFASVQTNETVLPESQLPISANPVIASTSTISSGTGSTIINTGIGIATVAEPSAAIQPDIIATSATTLAPLTSATATAVASTNVSDTSVVASTPSAALFVDSDAQALANITGNPAYAAAVAGLYVSVAQPPGEQASVATLPNTIESIQPIEAISAASAISQFGGQSSRDMNGRKQPQANGAARKQ